MKESELEDLKEKVAYDLAVRLFNNYNPPLSEKTTKAITDYFLTPDIDVSFGEENKVCIKMT